jgi:NAD(P)-dependent dehydrogenase (short-subunit alcohol dehydrogenase family)
MKNNWTTKNIPSQKGKTIIITGANSGLGLEAAKVLSSKGARVIMAVRSITKGQDAIAEINREYPTAQLELMQLDLSDLESIRNFADEFKQRHTQIDVLINNAGVMWPPKREETKQGFETQLGINHLGHFALTALLMDVIKQTPNSRIVTQSSIAHTAVSGLNFDDLNWEKSYNKTKAYGQSKLANLLFTYELDRKLKESKANTKAIACHPGVSNTNLFRTSASFVGKAINLIGQKAEMGALPMLRAATEEQLKGSEYIGPKGFMGFSGYPVEVKSTKTARDRQLAKRFWDVSAELTGTRFNFQ